MRRGEIVSPLFRKDEELLGHDDADGVHALIVCVGIAATIAKEARDGILGADSKRAPENVVCHEEKRADSQWAATAGYEKGRPSGSPFLKIQPDALATLPTQQA